MRNLIVVGVGILLIPFVVMVLSINGDRHEAESGASGPSLRWIITLFESPSARYREAGDTTRARETAKQAETLATWSAKIAEVRAKPKLMADIKRVVAELREAHAEIVAWENDALPLQTAPEGRVLTADPVIVEAAEDILLEERTTKEEIDNYIASLTPFLEDIRKSPAINVVPLASGDPAQIGAIEQTARNARASYQHGRNALRGLLADNAGRQPGPHPDLKSAIEQLKQQDAAREVTEKVRRRHALGQVQTAQQ